jgi:hypothetical protein
VRELVRSTIDETVSGTTKWRLIEVAGLDAWIRAFFGPAALASSPSIDILAD